MSNSTNQVGSNFTINPGAIDIDDTPIMGEEWQGSLPRSLKRYREDEFLELETSSGGTVTSYTGGGHILSPKNPSPAKRNTRKKRKLAHGASEGVKAEVDRWSKEFKHIDVRAYDGPLLESGHNKRRKPTYERGFAPPNIILQEFLEEVKPDLHGVNLDEMCFMTSNLKAQMDHLKHYDYEPKTPSPEVMDRFLRAADLVEAELDMWDPLPFPHEDDLDNVRFRPDRFPGWEYRAEGFKTRREAHPAALQDAKRTLSALLSGERVRPHFVRMGGRGKPVAQSQQSAIEEEVIKGRLILMTSSRDFLVCGATEQLLNDRFKDPDCFISVGDSWFMGGSGDTYKLYKDFVKFYCFDAKKYDAFLPPFMIRRAIQTLRRQFEDGLNSRYDAYWDFVERTMFRTEILRDDGVVFVKHTGTTSGHNHNSIIQSIISATLFVYAMMTLNPNLRGSELIRNIMYKTLGDDTLPATRPPIQPTHYRTIANLIWEHLGIDWRGEKSYATTEFLDIEMDNEAFSEEGRFQSVQYLGKYFTTLRYTIDEDEYNKVIPYRPFSETLARLYYPERPLRTEEKTKEELGGICYQRALGHILDGYGNPWTRAFLDQYCDWMEARDYHRVAAWESDTEDKFLMDYGAGHKKMDIVFKRFNFEEWIDLVVLPKSEVANLYSPVALFQAQFDDFLASE